MTRKDYERIASALYRTKPDRYADGPTDGEAPEYRTWRSVRDALASTMAIDNERFDRHRFMRAADGEGA